MPQDTVPPERPEEITMPIGVHESWLPSDHPLHRPRHGRRQRTALVCAAVYLLLPAIAFVFGVRPQVIENHRLAAFPGLGQGWAFFTGLGQWATDNLPLRDLGVRAEDGISQGVFGELPQQNNNSGGPLGPATGASAGSGPGGSPQTIGELRGQFPDVVKGKDGWLYYGSDMSSKCYPTQSLEKVAASVQEFQRIVTSSGRKLVIMVPPDKSTVLPQYMPEQYAGKQCMTAYKDKFWPAITASSSVLDLRAPLTQLQKADPDPIYFKTDTHWEDRSAIEALRSAVERIQPGVTKTWQVAKAESIQRSGDLAALSGSTETEPWQRYGLLPDGHLDGIQPDIADLSKPTRVRNAAKPGMVTEPTVILGDSFSLGIDRYARSAFTDVTFAEYQNLEGGNLAVRNLIVNSKVVVLEMLERGMASGNAELLMPPSLTELDKQLKAHPVR